MKSIILIMGIVCCGYFGSANTLEQVNFVFFKQLSIGRAHFGPDQACAIDYEGLKCWRGELLLDVPKLKNPVQVAVGAGHACAIDDEGVKCWDSEGDVVLRKYSNPVKVFAAGDMSCAIHDGGFNCWGKKGSCQPSADGKKINFYDSIGRPLFSWDNSYNLLDLSLAQMCAQSKKGPWVYCWNYQEPYSSQKHQETAHWPEFKNLKYVSMATLQSCGLDDEGVKCWNSKNPFSDFEHMNPDHGNSSMPELTNPNQLSSARDHTCAIDDNGVKCWGGNYQRLVPRLSNPIQVVAGYDYDCAIDDSGVQCWNEQGPVNLSHLKYFLTPILIKTTTQQKANFLKPLKTFDQSLSALEIDAKKQLLLFSIISPLILQTDSDYYQSKLISSFKYLKEVFYEKLSLHSDADLFYVIDATFENRKLALTALESSLDVSLSFLSGQQIDRTQDALRKVGQAMIDPWNNQNILEALKSVESLKEEREILLSSEKSKFLIESQQVAIDWLKLKVN